MEQEAMDILENIRDEIQGSFVERTMAKDLDKLEGLIKKLVAEVETLQDEALALEEELEAARG
jgi:hypothetical protein